MIVILPASEPHSDNYDVRSWCCTGELAGVEVKLTATPNRRHARTLATFAEHLGQRFAVGLVIHAGQHTVPLGERLWAVPVSALWRSDPSPD